MLKQPVNLRELEFHDKQLWLQIHVIKEKNIPAAGVLARPGMAGQERY